MLLQIQPNEEEVGPLERKKFEALVGKFVYISSKSRPDLSFTVLRLAEHLRRPTSRYLLSAQHVLKYLSHTRECTIKLNEIDFGKVVYMDVYSDSDFSAPAVSGFVIVLRGDRNAGPQSDAREITSCLATAPSIVHWGSKRQHSVSLSTGEAELCAAIWAIKQGEVCANLLRDLVPDVQLRKTIFVDQQGALDWLISKDKAIRKTRHLDMSMSYLLQHLEVDWRMQKVHTANNLADGLTKPLSRKITEMRQALGL